MRLLTTSWIFAVFCLVLNSSFSEAAPPTVDKQLIENERASIEGQWQLVLVEYGPYSYSETDHKWIFGKSDVKQQDAEKITDTFGWEIDPTKSPKHLDLLVPESKDPKAILTTPYKTKGIYSLNKNELKIAFTAKFAPGTPEEEERRAREYADKRPVSFVPGSDDKLIYTFKRLEK